MIPMNLFAGIDVGSRTIEFVLLEKGQVLVKEKLETSVNPLEQIKKILAYHQFSKLVATGYGRQLVQKNYNCDAVTEIKAYAKALAHFHPCVRAILDIGGQDTKAILLDDLGQIKKFEMNDKCAAGTGKFLEIMAMTLGFSVEKFGALALEVSDELTINNTCTVFAESEVISLVTQGYSEDKIAHAVHKSVAQKAVSLLGRVCSQEEKIFFAGGVAQNPTIVKLIKQFSQKKITVPEDPQFMGAIGAALIAMKE